jgi:hypothetical protein
MKNDSSLHSQISNFTSQLPKGYKQTEVGRPPECGLSKTVAEGHDENRGFAYWNGS